MLLSNFALMQHYHWSLEYIESLPPWERQVYIDLLQKWVKEEMDRIAKANGR
jgi:hypothetical protein